MSGIAGIVDYSGNIRNHWEAYTAMMATMSRRGPDANGMFVSESVCLMHARLAFSPEENCKQPMLMNQDGRENVIVCDGVLYNAEELRKELSACGHSFRNASDGEVLLHAYDEWGSDCVHKLNGAYAFAIWDGQTKKLLMVRDRMGGKPLFYALTESGLVFASEIKTLLRHPFVKAEIDRQSIAELLLIGPGRTPGYGVFKQIREVEPGYCGYFAKAGLELYSYWRLRARAHEECFEETLEHVRELLTDAIKRQSTCHGAMGSLLSGGLDSSIIAAISRAPRTFSVDYEENERYFKSNKFQPERDQEYIRMMTEFLGVPHTNITIGTDDLVDSLFEAVEARDLPGMADVDGSMLLLSRAVKPFINIALSGECADEVFGGYPWFRDPAVRGVNGFPWSQSTDYRASFLREDAAEGLDAAQYVHSRYESSLQKTDVLPGESALEKRMKEMFVLNAYWFMQTLIDRSDRMSMFSGLEVRTPFSDHRLVEYLYNVPWEQKDYKGREKGLLRMAMDGMLPDGVLWRKKSPYPKTYHPRYLQKVTEILAEMIADPAAPLLTFVRKEALEALIGQDEGREWPWYGQLMTRPQTIAYFVQMNYWLQKNNILISL